MDDMHAQLVVNEQLFLQATKTLGGLEGGDEKYELSSALHDYVREPYLAAHFREDVDREVGVEEQRAIETYVMGIYTPQHHNLYFEGIADDMEEFAGPAADFIRSAAWAFLTAWTQRYGGLNARLRTRGTLIDPTNDDVKGRP